MLWKYYDPDHILHERRNRFRAYIEKLYCHADGLLGEIMMQIGPEANLFIVSDHGAGGKQGSYFHLNAWLRQNGYLHTTLRSSLMRNPILRMLKGPLRRFAVKNLDVAQRRRIIRAKRRFDLSSLNFDKTWAYAFPVDEQTQGVVINLKGKQPSGIVTAAEYEPLRTELIAQLSKVRDPQTGRRVIRKCYRREELYSGAKATDAPDIIVVYEENYLAGFSGLGECITELPPSHLEEISGNHRREGVFMAYGPDISQGRLEVDANIMDVAPTVLYALGEKIPRDIEGKVIHSAFSERRLDKAPEFVDREVSVKLDPVDLSLSEQESMRDRLKDLGYM
jgi:predicted AlkP superfamily phosphohydrolase/phosphomutase